jgi:signal transduction histidine kinase
MHYQGPGQKLHQGSGIGLSFVKSTVALHKGYVAVESKVGEGTTFIVTLPSIKRINEFNRDQVELSVEGNEK